MLPTEANDWKSPLMAVRDAVSIAIPIPSYGHLKAYRCRAYPLTRERKAGLEKKRKLKPRAYVSYLVGYDSTNIFRIWVPALQTTIRTQDVTFNENLFFDPRTEDLTDQLVVKLRPVVKEVALPASLGVNLTVRLLHNL